MVSEFSQSLPRELASLFRLISLGISDLVARSSIVLLLVWRCFFMGDLARPKVLPYSGGVSDILRGTALLS